MCEGFALPLTHVDLTGGVDLGVAHYPLTDCCAGCVAADGCTAFVVFGSACYLKGGSLSPLNNTDRFAYSRMFPPSAPPSAPPPALPPSPPALPPSPPACATFAVAADTELSGADISTSSTPAEDCCLACGD